MNRHTLEQSLEIVRRIQPRAMALGYYIALAGGTLNKGYSDNDIDLVAIPRTKKSDRVNLLHYLVKTFTYIDQELAGQTMVYSFKDGDTFIELAIVDSDREIYPITAGIKNNISAL